MVCATGTLTVFFEEPFWVGIFERVENGGLSVAKVTFGSEPKDYELQDFICRYYYGLRFSPVVAVGMKKAPKNPKRVQRQVHKQLQETGVGTKSQQALKLQQELWKTERKHISKEQREAEKQHLFDLKQQKKKEKHRGH